ncbi:MAG: ribosome-associated translation inhibitor RaiA [Ignavibacteriales bacterium]|nr:hypothetical protein [Ignavibacteriaceae bacterium]MCK6613047.1 ribosome-associated translation inhibitor RaiA [Ignavibacteriaceae bacterium]QOJ29263.1 MAG: ribosome-associated translation inhibitor RaiA [Ignavibacteriales bacterium]
MQVLITARKFTARETLKDFIDAEVRSLEKIADDILDAEMILSFENNNNSVKTAELILKIPGHLVTANDSSDEFEKAVRGAVEKAERQIIKLKGKKQNH